MIRHGVVLPVPAAHPGFPATVDPSLTCVVKGAELVDVLVVAKLEALTLERQKLVALSVITVGHILQVTKVPLKVTKLVACIVISFPSPKRWQIIQLQS